MAVGQHSHGDQRNQKHDDPLDWTTALSNFSKQIFQKCCCFLWLCFLHRRRSKYSNQILFHVSFAKACKLQYKRICMVPWLNKTLISVLQWLNKTKSFLIQEAGDSVCSFRLIMIDRIGWRSSFLAILQLFWPFAKTTKHLLSLIEFPPSFWWIGRRLRMETKQKHRWQRADISHGETQILQILWSRRERVYDGTRRTADGERSGTAY